ncbi:hypothetical protein ABIF68_007377 [Bradyrhizobium japonicum]
MTAGAGLGLLCLEVLGCHDLERIAGAGAALDLFALRVLAVLHVERHLHHAIADAEVWSAVLALRGLEALRCRSAEGHTALLLAEGILEHPVPGAARADAKPKPRNFIVEKDLIGLSGIEPDGGKSLCSQLHRTPLGRSWEDRVCSRALMNARCDCWYLNDLSSLQE